MIEVTDMDLGHASCQRQASLSKWPPGIGNAVGREPACLSELSCTVLAGVSIKDTHLCMVLAIVRPLWIRCCA